MFSKLFGVTCIRPGCGHKNPKGAEFCEHCGISLEFDRPAILDGNQWQPAPDELAAFFKFKDMKKGFFTKTLYVPGGMKAWVLQDDLNKPVLLLNEGPHTTETLFQRMNNFFRSPYGDVLVVKTGSVPLDFAFDDLRSLEGLTLKAQVSLRVQVRVGEDEQRPDVAAFRRHFMQRPGVVTAEQLARPHLLGQSVRSALSSFVRARGVDEMAANPKLAAELDTHLRNQMGALLADLGLGLLEPTAFSLVHPRLDEQNRQTGELWLLRRDQTLQQDHVRQLNDLYDAAEREKLRARELEIQRKRQSGKLDEEDAELARALRLREVVQYEHILAATTREQAARMGAADEVAKLEQMYALRRRTREQQALGDQYKADDEQTEWRHLQAMAGIRRSAVEKLEAAQREHELLMQRERARNELAQLAAEHQIAAAKRLDDESERREALRAGVEASAKAALRAEQLKDAENASAVEAIELAAEVRRVEASRLQHLEDAQVQQKIDAMARDTAKGAMDDKLVTLGKLVELDHQDEANKQRREDERLDKELDRKIRERQQQYDQDLKIKEVELRKISLTGSLPMESLVLLADDPDKITALVQLATLKAHGTMSPEAILASVQATRPAPAPSTFAAAPPPAAPAGPSMDDKIRLMQQDERGLLRDVMRETRDQNREFLNVIEKMAGGLRDVGVANAGTPAQPAPTVIVSPPVVHAPVPPVPPPAAPAVLQQAFMACPHCRNLNVPGGRFCSSCGQALA